MIKTISLGELKSLLENDQVVVQRKSEICTINLGNFLTSMLEFKPFEVKSKARFVTLECDKNAFTLNDESLQEKISSVDEVIDHLKNEVGHLGTVLEEKTREFDERINDNRIGLNVFKGDIHLSLNNVREKIKNMDDDFNTMRVDFRSLEKRVSALERDVKSFLNSFKSVRAK